MNSTNPDLSELLGALTKAVPTLRKNGREAEEQGWIPQENIDILGKAGVYRAAVPHRYGGLDLSLADTARVLSEVARGCSSTGWVLSAWMFGAWTATLFPDAAQDEVFAGGEARLSGGFAPTGVAVPTEGGYRLSGSWKFNTGCRGAAWSMNAAVVQRDEEPVEAGHEEVILCLVPMDELKIVDDWQVTAAAGTGSDSTVAQDVFVPTHRTLGFEEALTNTGGGRSHARENGRYYALAPVTLVESAAACLGTARGAYELFLERLPGRGITYTAWVDQTQHPLTQIQVATAQSKLAAAEALVESWQPRLQKWADAGEQPPVEQRAAVVGECAYAILLAKEAVDTLHSASGGSVIRKENPFQRFYRDLHGLSLHALLLANTNLETYGRVLLGLDPGTPFV
ncbi:acyl-CoA dehydrogenase family protein [Streptomyces sp. NPDC051105]|uniref:acyl-CoA dehydrogenase family protein n=1 Tax=Streptomyces sp. NPDC051105 TaxID=3154843 RepID=UPI0034431770